MASCRVLFYVHMVIHSKLHFSNLFIVLKYLHLFDCNSVSYQYINHILKYISLMYHSPHLSQFPIAENLLLLLQLFCFCYPQTMLLMYCLCFTLQSIQHVVLLLSVIYTNVILWFTDIQILFIFLKMSHVDWQSYILFIFTHVWRRQWHPTPVLLPGKSHGRRSLVGCSPWGR